VPLVVAHRGDVRIVLLVAYSRADGEPAQDPVVRRDVGRVDPVLAVALRVVGILRNADQPHAEPFREPVVHDGRPPVILREAQVLGREVLLPVAALEDQGIRREPVALREAEQPLEPVLAFEPRRVLPVVAGLGRSPQGRAERVIDPHGGRVDRVVDARVVVVAEEEFVVNEERRPGARAMVVARVGPMTREVRGPLELAVGIAVLEHDPVARVEPVGQARADVVLGAVLVCAAVVSQDVVAVVQPDRAVLSVPPVGRRLEHVAPVPLPACKRCQEVARLACPVELLARVVGALEKIPQAEGQVRIGVVPKIDKAVVADVVAVALVGVKVEPRAVIQFGAEPGVIADEGDSRVDGVDPVLLLAGAVGQEVHIARVPSLDGHEGPELEARLAGQRHRPGRPTLARDEERCGRPRGACSRLLGGGGSAG